MNNIHFITSIAISFAAGILLFHFGLPFARKKGWVDNPNSRRRHAYPIPIVGGILIFAAWLIGLFIYFIQGREEFTQSQQSILAVTSGVILIVALGIIDDLRGLPPKVKLLFQLVATLMIVLFEPNVNAFCLDWESRIGIFAWLLAITWIIGMSNAINLIDGLDGLSGGVSIFILVSLIFLDLQWGAPTHLPTIFLGTLLPLIFIFLKHNWTPAKVFMGDAGSLSIGFLIGTTSLMGPIQSGSWTQIFNIILMCGYPILDMGLCSYRRFRYKTGVFKADRNHMHHRLLRLGLPIQKVLVIILSITFYLQLTAIFMIELLRNDAIRTDRLLLDLIIFYMSAIAISLFSLLYMLRMIERQRTEVLSDENESRGNTFFKECLVIKIDLEPLLESGLFEEKSRIRELIFSLKTMLQSQLTKENSIYFSRQKLHILCTNEATSQENIQKLEKFLQEKLNFFKNLYNIQYSLASLPMSFEIQEFMIDNQSQPLFGVEKSS